MPISAMKALRLAKPPVGRHADGRNLYLRVTPGGTKTWVCIWHPKGVKWQKEMKIGPADIVSREEARDVANTILKQVWQGLDPKEQRKIEKVSNLTFNDMMEQFIANERAAWKTAKEETDFRAKFVNHAKALLKKRIAEITADDIAAAVQPIWHTKNTTAKYILSRSVRIMARAIEEKAYTKANPAIFADVSAKFGRLAPKVDTSHEALPGDKVGEFLQTVMALGPNRLDAMGLALIALTAVRTAGARFAQWSNIDLAQRTWRIPREHNKHDNKDQKDGSLIIPLSEQAVALLSSLPRSPAGSDWVFWSPKDPSKPVGAHAFIKLVVKLGYGDQMTVHGLRSTFRTWVDDVGLNRDEAELSLGHDLPGSSVEKAYARSDMLERRAVLMQRWANFCQPPVVNDNVVVEIAAKRKRA